jgi:polysaccharide pyruvyl transferase WcaK-like protein
MAADTALLLSVNKNKDVAGFQRPVLCVSLGVYSHTFPKQGIRWFVNVCSRALDAAIEKHGFNVVFLPHYVSGFRYDDLEVSQLIYNSMKFKDSVRIMNPLSLEDYKALLSGADMVVSSKMHPAVLAAASLVPTLCIVYDDKQAGFFEQLGLGDCTLPVTDLSFESFLSKIDYVWGRKEHIKAVLDARISKLQEKIRFAVQKVLMQRVKCACFDGNADV